MTKYNSINFIPTDQYNGITLIPEQEKYISKIDKIHNALKQPNNKGFYIYLHEEKIGFILLNHFSSNGFFLWDFIIDKKFQKKGYGKESLILLSIYLKENFHADFLTTTYISGNHQAKKLYESIGFEETDKVVINDVIEINMRLNL